MMTPLTRSEGMFVSYGSPSRAVLSEPVTAGPDRLLVLK